MKRKMKSILLVSVFLAFILHGCGSANVKDADEFGSPSVSSVTEEQNEYGTVNTETVESLSKQEGYYYAQLSKEEQIVYQQIHQALLQRTDVVVDTLSLDVLDKVFLCVLNDHPEIFYVSGYVYTTHSRGDETVSLSVAGKYDYDEAECQRREALLEANAEQILNQIPQDASDYDKIKYIFDTLVNETEYASDATDNQNICSVLLTDQSTCQGYAKATQYLLNKAGVETTFVSGDVAEGSHAWNLVKADGDWYYLDTTWGDVDYQSQRDEEAIDAQVMAINYDYFMICSDRLYQTHEPDRIVPLPDCVATRNNYYVHEGKYLTGLDTEVLHEIFEEAYANGETTVQFQCANDAVFNLVSEYLLEEQHIFDFVKAGNSVAYVDNPETDTFCFWL